jgi:hypothetical protein
MKQERITKMRTCSHSLPYPGGEVVRECLDEIVRLTHIAEQVHDRLLRGDSDKELLELLETTWQGEK